MSNKSDFLKLTSRITAYLKRTLRRKERTKQNADDPIREVANQFETREMGESGPDPRLRAREQGPRPMGIPDRAVDLERVREFRRKMERAYGAGQQATNPWIKLGLDLGTSSAKVVWRGDANVFPICFGDEPLSLSSYLFPSLVSFDGAALRFGFEAQATPHSEMISNFKMCLACTGEHTKNCGPAECSLTKWPLDKFCEELNGLEVAFINSCFLATLLAESKRAIIAVLSRHFRDDVSPKWTANMAVPETFIENSPIADEFRTVLRTGWLMSEVLKDEPGMNERTSLFECFIAGRELASESVAELNDVEFGCAIYPEVGAEVASIVMSRLSEEGLYAFVDVGAGTVDVSLFNYFRDGGSANRPPYAAAVSKSLGAARFEALASRMGGELDQRELKKVKELYYGMTEAEREEASSQLVLLKKAAKTLRPQVKSFLQDVLRSARDGKDRNLVNQKLRLVLGGGGSYLKTYSESALEAFSFKHENAPQTELTFLKKPTDFQMPLPSDQFHRFAVAYGLSYPLDSLPAMIFPKDVKMRVEPKKKDHRYASFYEK